MSAPSVLTEERRLQLDSIVDRATNDGLPPEEIQFIVNDFKRIHGTKAAPKSKGLPRGEITDKGTFSFGSQDVSPFDPTKANIQDEVTGQSVNPFAGVKAGASAGVKKTVPPTQSGKTYLKGSLNAKAGASFYDIPLLAKALERRYNSPPTKQDIDRVIAQQGLIQEGTGKAYPSVEQIISEYKANEELRKRVAPIKAFNKQANPVIGDMILNALPFGSGKAIEKVAPEKTKAAKEFAGSALNPLETAVQLTEGDQLAWLTLPLNVLGATGTVRGVASRILKGVAEKKIAKDAAAKMLVEQGLDESKVREVLALPVPKNMKAQIEQKTGGKLKGFTTEGKPVVGVKSDVGPPTGRPQGYDEAKAAMQARRKAAEQPAPGVKNPAPVAPTSTPKVVKVTTPEQSPVPVIKNTHVPVKSAKPPTGAKVDKVTGLTAEQTDYVSKALQAGAKSDSPFSVKVPGDGRFELQNAKQASSLHEALTGKTLTGDKGKKAVALRRDAPINEAYILPEDDRFIDLYKGDVDRIVAADSTKKGRAYWQQAIDKKLAIDASKAEEKAFVDSLSSRSNADLQALNDKYYKPRNSDERWYPVYKEIQSRANAAYPNEEYPVTKWKEKVVSDPEYIRLKDAADKERTDALNKLIYGHNLPTTAAPSTKASIPSKPPTASLSSSGKVQIVDDKWKVHEVDVVRPVKIPGFEDRKFTLFKAGRKYGVVDNESGFVVHTATYQKDAMEGAVSRAKMLPDNLKSLFEVASKSKLKASQAVKAEIDATKAAMLARGKKLKKNAGGSPITKEDLDDLAKMAGLHVKYYGYKAKEFVEEIVKDFGEEFRVHAEAAYAKYAPKTAPTASPKPDAPKTTVQTPKTGVSGGISRAAMVDQAEQLGTDMPKSIQGEPNAVVMARAKEAVVSGKFDPYAKAKQLTDEGRPPSRDEAAGFIEYRKAQKEKIVDANRKLESKTLGQKEREALLMERAEAIAEANQFNKLVIRPRGETGGVLQMFREESGVVWHDLDDVKLEIERVTGKAPTNLPRLSDAVKQARKAKEFLDDVTANGYVRTVYKNRAEDVAKVRSARASAKARLQSRLSGTFKEEMSSANIPVKLLWNVARQAPGVVKDVLEISKTVIQEFGFKLADKRLYNAIRKELDGIEITDDEIRALLGRQYDEYKPSTPTDYSKIRAQAAKEEDAIAALEGRATRKQAKRLQSIADRKRTLGGTIRTGITVAPENRIVDPVVENARLKLAIMEQRVQGIARLQGVPKSRRVARDFLSTARVLKLGSDFGVLLRQGMYGLTHPKAYAASLQKILPAMKGDDVMYAIEETSNLKRLPDGRFAEPLRRRAGLSRSSYFTDPEEAFLVQWAKKVPGLKTVVGKLERGQTAFLNTLRNEMFDSFAAAHPKADIEELEKWASFVNSATGRSNMKQVPHYAEWIMTSPRYEISRWEMVGRYARSPKTMALALKSPAARRELMSLGTVAGTMIGALKLGEAGGLWETNLDPTSADFLKIRIGNKVFDFTAGISPRVRSAAMLVAASSATTVPARVKAWLNGERYVPDDLKADGTPKKYDPDKDFSKEFGEMATRTVSPGLSALPSAITNRGLTGYLLDEGEGGLWLAAPLIVAGAAKGYKDGGVGGAVSMAIPEFLGAGTNTYPKKGTTTQSTKKPSAPPLSLAERGF